MLRGVLAASAALFCCAPGWGATSLQCDSGCTILPQSLSSGALDVGFTIPTDGNTYQWTFATDQPGITFELPNPNETYWEMRYRNRPATFTYSPAYRFEEDIKPNLTTIIVSAPRAYDFCSDPGPDGELCAELGMFWGNNVWASFYGVTGPFTLTTTYEQVASRPGAPVPEPASWSLMLLGFLVIGAKARSPRTAKSRHVAALT